MMMIIFSLNNSDIVCVVFLSECDYSLTVDSCLYVAFLCNYRAILSVEGEVIGHSETTDFKASIIC